MSEVGEVNLRVAFADMNVKQQRGLLLNGTTRAPLRLMAAIGVAWALP